VKNLFPEMTKRRSFGTTPEVQKRIFDEEDITSITRGGLLAADYIKARFDAGYVKGEEEGRLFDESKSICAERQWVRARA
jgi:hypothetical protein